MTPKTIDPDKMSDKALDAHRAALQHDRPEPLAGSPEIHDEGGVLHAPKSTKKNGLPDDEPLRRSLTDTDLIVSESSGRQFRRQWDADDDGVEITGTETWVEVEQRGDSTIGVDDGAVPGKAGASTGHASEEAPAPAAESADEKLAREAAEKA